MVVHGLDPFLLPPFPSATPMTPSSHPSQSSQAQVHPSSTPSPSLTLSHSATSTPPQFFFPFAPVGSLPSYSLPSSSQPTGQSSSTVESTSSSYQSNPSHVPHSSSLPFSYPSLSAPSPMVATSYSPAERSPAPPHTPGGGAMALQHSLLNDLNFNSMRIPLTSFNPHSSSQQQSLQQAIHHAAQLHQQQMQQQGLYAYGLPLHPSIDLRSVPSTNPTPVTATATVHSSLPVAPPARPLPSPHSGKSDKRKLHAESTASLRRKKHKEVEIKRRKKINSLFNDLTVELECGPTDKASILLYALTFIRGVKGKYGAGLDMQGLIGVGVGGGVEGGVKREGEGEGDVDDDGAEGDEDEEVEEEGREKAAEGGVVGVKGTKGATALDEEMESRKTSDSSAASSPASLSTSASVSKLSGLTVDTAASTSSLGSSSATSQDR